MVYRLNTVCDVSDCLEERNSPVKGEQSVLSSKYLIKIKIDTIRKRLPIAWKPFNVMVPGAGLEPARYY